MHCLQLCVCHRRRQDVARGAAAIDSRPALAGADNVHMYDMRPDMRLRLTQGSNTNAAMLAMAAKEDQVEDGHMGFVQVLAHLTERIHQSRPVLFQK